MEQISDWLTKILVGVGLTQLTALPEISKRLGEYFGVAIGATEGASRIAIIIIVFFSVSGFLFGYLWTRLFLGSELARADLNAVSEQVREVVEAQEEQSQIDANAISLVNQYLTVEDATKISVDLLKSDVERASPPVKVLVYYQARELRSVSWQLPDDIWKVERTIPIFEALVASDKANRFHNNHGQLGFALIDQSKKNYARAETELTAAINIRGPASEGGWEIYEFNRAICRIKQNAEFEAGSPSPLKLRDEILSDLKVALTKFQDLFQNADIIKWLELNKIEDLSIRSNDDKKTTVK